MWVAASILLSPIAWPHYLTLLIIPALLLVQASLDGRASARAQVALVAQYLLCAVWLGYWARFGPRFLAGRATNTSFAMILVAELGFVAMALGFLFSYWSATDRDPAA